METRFGIQPTHKEPGNLSCILLKGGTIMGDQGVARQFRCPSDRPAFVSINSL
jgi:hypothetical protein